MTCGVHSLPSPLHRCVVAHPRACADGRRCHSRRRDGGFVLVPERSLPPGAPRPDTSTWHLASLQLTRRLRCSELTVPATPRPLDSRRVQDAGGVYFRRWGNISNSEFVNSSAARVRPRAHPRVHPRLHPRLHLRASRVCCLAMGKGRIARAFVRLGLRGAFTRFLRSRPRPAPQHPQNGGAIAGDVLYIAGSRFASTSCGSPISWMMTGISLSTIGAGGAVYSVLDLTVVNSTFDTAHADQSGGAICAVRGLTVLSSDFRNCSAGFFGGVLSVLNVALTPGPLVVRGSRVSGSYAALDGGAIYSENPVLVEGTTFEDCAAGRNGGAICSRSDRDLQAADLVIRGSAFINTASGEAGGAVFGSGSQTAVSQSLFRNSSSVLVRRARRERRRLRLSPQQDPFPRRPEAAPLTLTPVSCPLPLFLLVWWRDLRGAVRGCVRECVRQHRGGHRRRGGVLRNRLARLLILLRHHRAAGAPRPSPPLPVYSCLPV